MKKTSCLMAVVASATMCAAVNSQATIILGPTTVVWPAGGAGPTLDVTYYVDLTGTTFSYYYVVTPPVGAGYNLSSFTVDVSQQATLSNVASTAGAAYAGYSIIPDVSLTWNYNDLTGPVTNSFTSQYSPVVFGVGSATTTLGGTWSSNTQDIPVPVPEASTIVAGLLMTVPLGIGVVRSMRKDRSKANK